MHGIAACRIADTYAQDLRRAATKALRLSGAGSNTMLRLSLQDDMNADPGFYQIQSTILQFRRLTHKCDDLLMMWKTWFSHFDGKLHPGPFLQLHHCFEVLGWGMISPPWFYDHEMNEWNLLTIDRHALLHIIQDGWLQFVASQTKHNTMRDLTGMDTYLTLAQSNKLLPLDRARLSALQSGAFITVASSQMTDFIG